MNTLTKRLTVVLTLVVAFFYYLSFHHGENIASLALQKSKLSIDFDFWIKCVTVAVALIFLYFMNQNFVKVQGTWAALVMVLTAIFSAWLIWYIPFNGIEPSYLKWGLVLCLSVSTLYLSWPPNSMGPDIYPIIDKNKRVNKLKIIAGIIFVALTLLLTGNYFLFFSIYKSNSLYVFLIGKQKYLPLIIPAAFIALLCYVFQKLVLDKIKDFNLLSHLNFVLKSLSYAMICQIFIMTMKTDAGLGWGIVSLLLGLSVCSLEIIIPMIRSINL